MPGDVLDSLTVREGKARWRHLPVAMRVLAWGALLGATGLLVRAEVERPPLPGGVVAYTDLVYRRDGDRRARLDGYVPDPSPPPHGRPAVLAIHGGGWRGGNKTAYGRMAAALAG